MSEPEPARLERATRERLSDSQMARLRSYGEVRDWAAGDVLFREGEPSYDFFVILSGRVVVLDGYGTTALRELAEGGPGDFVAELNLFTGEPLYTTAVVREPASLLAVRRAALVELMGTDPDLADVVMPTVFVRRQWLSQHQVGMRLVGSVVVVGGGNSAGQAATALAAAGHAVTLVVRGPKLADSMVRYLVDRVEREPRIEVLTDSEVVGLAGEHSAPRTSSSPPVRGRVGTSLPGRTPSPPPSTAWPPWPPADTATGRSRSSSTSHFERSRPT